MKTSQIKWFAWVFLALISANAIAFSGNLTDKKDRNKPVEQRSCINSISGLSELQKEKITSMEIQHFATMNEFKEKIQSSTDKKQKAEIRKEMDQQIEIHGNSVKSVLSADQQKQFIMLQAQGDRQSQMNQTQGKGKGSGHGSGSGNGSGRGMGMGNRSF
jgi:hypothetical protein